VRHLFSTPNYVAPEIVRNVGHHFEADYWAYGVVIYEMVTGENPFFYDGMGQVELYQSIVEEDPYPFADDKNASSQVKDIVDKLLVKEPKDRLGTNSLLDILMHPWFKGMPDLDEIRAKRIKAPSDDDLDQTLNFDELSLASEAEDEYWEQDVVVEQEQEEEEEELPKWLESAQIGGPKSHKEPSKFFFAPTNKGKKKGYLVKPKTKDQEKESLIRRQSLEEVLDDTIVGVQDVVDVIKLDAKALQIIKPGVKRDSNIGQYKPENGAKQGNATSKRDSWNKIDPNHKWSGKDGFNL
jgi:serine/threonine protein kinase